MGMRVEAVWVAKDELGPDHGVGQVLPAHGEPDADYETFKEYL